MCDWDAVPFEYFAARVVHFQGADGEEQDLPIRFELAHTVEPAPYCDTCETHWASASFTFLGERHRLRGIGEDHIVALSRAMRLSGEVLMRDAEARGVSIYEYTPGDAKAPADLFK
ncbi:hypothetical protein [Caulobacter sp.]|uniref:hypothetical protein n=1 Tax=Caulobacter sp. TaxID=78 RepID=UPI003BAB372D